MIFKGAALYQAYSLTLVGAVWRQVFDSVILISPFQLELFYREAPQL